MIARTSQCDAGRLKSFLNDDLSELEHARLNDHLEACSDCQRSLERLAAGSELWGELRRLTPKLGGDSLGPECSVPGTADYGSGGRAERSSGYDNLLGFLASSAEPGSLGRLGPYEVSEVIGHGGFGVVLKAFDPALGRAVAIKVLAPQLATSAAARGRFAREARAAAAVVHENVVAIHSVDSWKNLPYLVMPYIAGQSLQERVDRDGPMDQKAILRIGIQTAQGLASAHAQGLVHRDVKPSNILLENGVERVKLTDFGLARAVDDASLTQSGVVAGTPQYMSPEQARGEAVDHRSDLFSLGSVFYFMCTGHAPFRASSTPAVLRRVSDEEPRSVREINVDVPVWLAAIIERLHAKDPARRFASAREVATVLEQSLAALQQGLPVTAKLPGGSVNETRRRPGRKTAVAAVLSMSACVLAVAAYEIKPGVFGPVQNALLVLQGDGKAAANAQDAGKGHITINDSSQSKTIVGSGKLETKTWDLTDFSRVHVGSTFHAKISKGKQFKVTTTVDDNILPFVEVVKDEKSLKIGLKQGQSFKFEKAPEAEIVLPVLEGIDLSGASKGHLEGFDDEKNVVVRASGASKLDGSLTVAKAKVDASGASSLTLTGGAQEAELDASGASHLVLGQFPLKQGKLDLSGAATADIVVRSTAPFTANVSGASKLGGKLDTSELTLKAEGACHAKLEGSAKNAKVTVSGASHLDLGGVKTETMKITVSGASHANVAASESLDYDVSSVSHLKYTGKPAHVGGKRTGGSHVSHE